MNYNFLEELKRYLIAIKIKHLGYHILIDIPFYGGHLRLDFEIRDGFFMNVTGTANVLNEFKVVESLSIEFATASVIAENVVNVLNEFEREAQKERLGMVTIKKQLERK